MIIEFAFFTIGRNKRKFSFLKWQDDYTDYSLPVSKLIPVRAVHITLWFVGFQITYRGE